MRLLPSFQGRPKSFRSQEQHDPAKLAAQEKQREMEYRLRMIEYEKEVIQRDNEASFHAHNPGHLNEE